MRRELKSTGLTVSGTRFRARPQHLSRRFFCKINIFAIGVLF
jgi:hypothetical protein